MRSHGARGCGGGRWARTSGRRWRMPDMGMALGGCAWCTLGACNECGVQLSHLSSCVSCRDVVGWAAPPVAGLGAGLGAGGWCRPLVEARRSRAPVSRRGGTLLLLPWSTEYGNLTNRAGSGVPGSRPCEVERLGVLQAISNSDLRCVLLCPHLSSTSVLASCLLERLITPASSYCSESAQAQHWRKERRQGTRPQSFQRSPRGRMSEAPACRQPLVRLLVWKGLFHMSYKYWLSEGPFS